MCKVSLSKHMMEHMADRRIDLVGCDVHIYCIPLENKQ